MGLYAIKLGIYRDRLQSASRRLMENAYGLCFFPEKHMVAAVDCLERQVPRFGDGQKFGVALIKYIRNTWLNQKIR